MKCTRIAPIVNDMQYTATKEGTQMSERMFVSSLIRENAKPVSGGYSLHVSDLTQIDQKLLLSYCVATDTYEWACENPIRLNTVIQEYADDMQYCIDELIDDVYTEDMEEMSNLLCHHKDNGEPFWGIK